MNFGVCCGNGVGQTIDKQVICRNAESVCNLYDCFKTWSAGSGFELTDVLTGKMNLVCKVFLREVRLVPKKRYTFSERRVCLLYTSPSPRD